MPNISTAERIDSHITEVHIPTLWSFHSPILAVETSEEPWRPCRRFGNTQRSFGHIQLEAVRAYVKSRKVWNTRKRHPTSLWSYPRLVIGNASRIRAALEAFDRLWLLVCWQVSTFSPSNQVEIPSRVGSNAVECVESTILTRFSHNSHTILTRLQKMKRLFFFNDFHAILTRFSQDSHTTLTQLYKSMEKTCSTRFPCSHAILTRLQKHGKTIFHTISLFSHNSHTMLSHNSHTILTQIIILGGPSGCLGWVS